jgi:hypothetical protein
MHMDGRTDRQTDRYDEASSRLAQFKNAPEKLILYRVCITRDYHMCE